MAVRRRFTGSLGKARLRCSSVRMIAPDRFSRAGATRIRRSAQAQTKPAPKFGAGFDGSVARRSGSATIDTERGLALLLVLLLLARTLAHAGELGFALALLLGLLLAEVAALALLAGLALLVLVELRFACHLCLQAYANARRC